MRLRLYQISGSKKLIEVVPWVIPVAALIFIALLLNSKTQNLSLTDQFGRVYENSFLFFYLPFLLLLTFLNIGFEALKWFYSLKPELNLSLKESYFQSLMAMTAGFITPFRSGALIARMMSNSSADKNLIVRKSLHMATAQFMVTLLFGVIGINFLIFHFSPSGYFYPVLLFNTLFLFLFFCFSRSKNIYKHKSYSWLEIKLEPKLFFLSSVRYVIFSFQYLIILNLFGVEYPFPLLAALVFVTFLVNTILPAGILGKIGIRELTGILIIGETTGFVIETSCAAFFIWTLNQALPAFAGIFIYVRRNFRVS